MSFPKLRATPLFCLCTDVHDGVNEDNVNIKDFEKRTPVKATLLGDSA